MIVGILDPLAVLLVLARFARARAMSREKLEVAAPAPHDAGALDGAFGSGGGAGSFGRSASAFW